MKKITITLALVLSASASYSQILNTDKTGSPFNPALAGFNYADQVNLTHNRMNSPFGSPLTNVEFSTFSEKHKIGWGVNYLAFSSSSYYQLYSKIESYSGGFALLNLNKQFDFGNDRWLSAGIGVGGLVGKTVSYDYFSSESERSFDFEPVANLGMAYRTERFNLNGSVLAAFVDGGPEYGLTLAASYAFGNEEGLQIIPQVTANLMMPAASTAGVTFKYKSKYSLGGGITRNYGLTGAYASVGYLYKEKIKFNYTYGISPGSILGNFQQHEFSVSFQLGKR